MKKGEIMPEIRRETESLQIKQGEVKTMHEVGQSNGFFKRKSKGNAINQGSLGKRLSAQTNKKAHVIITCFLERKEGRRYVDTYSRRSNG